VNDKLIAEARALIAQLSEGTKVSPDDALHMLTVLCSALEEAEKQIPRWISCGERMPEELDGEQEYRCLVSHQRFNDMRPCFTWVDTARFKNGKFWSDTPTTHTIPLLVTHWMPLPKGAEEEK